MQKKLKIILKIAYEYNELMKAKQYQQKNMNNPHQHKYNFNYEKHFNEYCEFNNQNYFSEDMKDLIQYNIIGKINKYDVRKN